jgi:hypothetical protein
MFCASLLLLAFADGVVLGRFEIFPYAMITDATRGERSVYYAGRKAAPFYTDIMGKHQWLPNGDLLITESMKGRAFEIDRNGRVVREYVNLVGDSYAALMEEVQRLPERMNDTYSEANVSAKCAKVHD